MPQQCRTQVDTASSGRTRLLRAGRRTGQSDPIGADDLGAARLSWCPTGMPAVTAGRGEVPDATEPLAELASTADPRNTAYRLPQPLIPPSHISKLVLVSVDDGGPERNEQRTYLWEVSTRGWDSPLETGQ